MADHHGPINVNVNVSQSQNQSQAPSQGGSNGCTGCLGTIGVLMVIGFIGKAFDASPVLGSIIVAVIVIAAVFGIVAWITAQQEEKRVEAAKQAAAARAAEVRTDVESRAEIDAVGGCGWCGHPGSHRGTNGHPVHPRDWHALDIEEAVRAAVGGPGTSRPSSLPKSGMTPPPAPTELPPVPPAATPLPRTPTRTVGMRRPPRAHQDDLYAELSYDEAGECRWCGSPVEHRTEHGRIIHPAKFHQAEYEAERASRERDRDSP